MEVEAPCGVPFCCLKIDRCFKTDLWGSLSTGVDKLPQRSLLDRALHHHIIIREQELKVFSFRIYIKRDPAADRVMRPEHNFLKAIFIQGRLKDLIALFVMPKEWDQFAVFHTDAVGIQANVVPELVVFGKKFIDQSKLSFIGASIGDADLKGNLLKALLKAALIGHALHIIYHLIRLYFFAIEDDNVGQSIQTGMQFATCGIVFKNALDADGKVVTHVVKYYDSVIKGKDGQDRQIKNMTACKERFANYDREKNTPFVTIKTDRGNDYVLNRQTENGEKSFFYCDHINATLPDVELVNYVANKNRNNTQQAQATQEQPTQSSGFEQDNTPDYDEMDEFN